MVDNRLLKGGNIMNLKEIENKVKIMTICPKHGEELENFDWQEGGYCSKCDSWWPPDLVKDFLEEQL